MEHYFGITVHVLHNREIKVMALQLSKCDEQDGKSIFKVIKKCAKEFTIGQRIRAICTDNGKCYLILAAPNRIFTELFEKWAIKHSYPFRSQLGWIRCFNHCINIAVESKTKLNSRFY